jgi:N-hydroxyarylamine O-acetyltransferase
MIDRTAYLNRIKYAGSVEPEAAVLHALQRAHLLSVPFENLDIHLGREIRLDEDSLFDKIVARRRGGFCYELNGLFALLLENIGFRVLHLAARGYNDDGTYGKEFDHLLLQVHAPDDPETAWLVDAGWGDGPLEPLLLLEPGLQRQRGRAFQLQPDGCHLILSEKKFDGSWLPFYRFNLHPFALTDFQAMCMYHQSSPYSIFTQKRLATMQHLDGRVTLSNRRLIVTRESGLRGSRQRQERELSGEDEMRQVLAGMFGIILEP